MRPTIRNGFLTQMLQTENSSGNETGGSSVPLSGAEGESEKFKSNTLVVLKVEPSNENR